MTRLSGLVAIALMTQLSACKTPDSAGSQTLDSTAPAAAATGTVQDFSDLLAVLPEGTNLQLGACEIRMLPGGLLSVVRPEAAVTFVPLHLKMGDSVQWKDGVFGPTKTFVNSGTKTAGAEGQTLKYDLAEISKDEFTYFSHYELSVEGDAAGSLKALHVQEGTSANVFGIKVGKIYVDPAHTHDCK